MDTKPIPETITVAGVEVPTDVLERSFKPDFKVVQAAMPNARKVRVDPIVPGISISNARKGAGSVACIVYDQRGGTPYVLSNRHALEGMGAGWGTTLRNLVPSMTTEFSRIVWVGSSDPT